MRPLPLYRLDPALSPTGPQLAGWRFQLCDGQRTTGAAETMLTPDGWAFSHFGGGPFIASTERALIQSEALSGEYQPRLLSVPRLYMLTLWLHSEVAAPAESGEPGAADLLVPLAPAPPGIAPHVPLAMGDLLTMLNTRLASPLAT